MLLYSDTKTRCLEKNGKWVDCVHYLLEIKQSKKGNLSFLLKLAVNTWYALTLDGLELSLSDADREFLFQTLLDNYRFFLEFLESNETCQWIWGYMMVVRTDLFLITELDYDLIEQKGRILIEKASRRGNVFAQLLYAREKNNQEEIDQCRIKVEDHLSSFFDPDEEVGSYFIEVLTAE